MADLSKKSSYAIRALLALTRAHGQGPVLIADLAEREHIPRKFLELILLELRNAGLLHSKKGRGGGYWLARPPDEVTLGQVIRIFDGPLAWLPCAGERAFRKCDECPDADACGLRAVMRDVREATACILDGMTLTKLVRREELLRHDRRRPWFYEI